MLVTQSLYFSSFRDLLLFPIKCYDVKIQLQSFNTFVRLLFDLCKEIFALDNFGYLTKLLLVLSQQPPSAISSHLPAIFICKNNVEDELVINFELFVKSKLNDAQRKNVSHNPVTYPNTVIICYHFKQNGSFQ